MEQQIKIEIGHEYILPYSDKLTTLIAEWVADQIKNEDLQREIVLLYPEIKPAKTMEVSVHEGEDTDG